MYTVVIAEQKHLDSIREHDLFLQPFLEKNSATFCAWNTEGDSLAQMVPELRRSTQRGDKWRAIIVMDEAHRMQKNPFDCVQHKVPTREQDETEDAYRERRLLSRLESYEAAARFPLSRLCAYLCEFPSISEKGDGYLDEDPDFREFRIADAKKKELQRAIVGTEPQDFIKPSEILCIALRTYSDEQYDIRAAWSTHLELEYSHFADYNLYYPKMRYLLYDIVSPEHRNYPFDNIRFLYALLLLAGNEIPRDALQAGKVYRLTCENDVSRLSDLLQTYDNRLVATQKMIEDEIALIKSGETQDLSDKEMTSIFFGKTSIAVRPEKSFDVGEIFVHPNRFGFFSDKPEEETLVWKQEYRQSKNGLARYLKQPKRAIRAAVADTRMQNENPEAERKVHQLNEQQIGDFREHMNDDEAAVIETQPDNLSDPTQYFARAEESAKQVEKHLETRMKRKTGFAAIAIAIAAFLIGAIPTVLIGKVNLYLIIALCAAVGLIVLTALFCLLAQRSKLRGKLRAYNDCMRGVSGSIRSNMERYSTYLGHVCDLMKEARADNTLREDSDEQQNTCKIYRKHIVDIINLRAECGLTFSQFLETEQKRESDVQPFLFDYRKAVNYRYPITGTETETTRVEFLQAGNYIELPVNYIKSIELRREELYD